MKVTYNHQEMLAQWKLRRHMLPLRTDCTVERTDSADIDTIFAAEMRSRYLELLATAPDEFLAPADLTQRVGLTRGSTQGTVVMTLPEGTVRLLSVKLVGWERPAIIVKAGEGSRIERLQQCEFSRGGVAQPVAVIISPTQVVLYGTPTIMLLPQAEYVSGIEDCGADSYSFDERAWELLLNT